MTPLDSVRVALTTLAILSITSASLVLPAERAMAQDTSEAAAPADAEARAHFEAARRAYDTGDFPLAVRELEASYELSHRVQLLYNIYSAAERGGMWSRAAEALEQFLRDGDPGPQRADLESRLEHLRARIVSESGEASTEEPRPGGGVHPAGIGVLIGAGVLLAGFGALAALSAAEDESLRNACAPACAPDRVSTLETLTILADVSWIAAASAGVVGVVLLFVLPPESSAAPEARLTLQPYAAPGGVGASLRGAF